MQETNKNEKDLLSIGKSYFENKDYQNAIKTFSKATKLKPDNIDNWFLVRTISFKNYAI